MNCEGGRAVRQHNKIVLYPIKNKTKYNILRLDELDGGLDTFNRGYFITLLDQLMNLLS